MHELPEGVEIVNLVHDEVDAIVTRETLEATVDLITRAFQKTFAEFYPSRSSYRTSNSPPVAVGEKPFRSMERRRLELFLVWEEGIRFASERESALIADEMGDRSPH
jgi:hypothetical protein